MDLSDNSIDDACAQPLRNLIALKQLRRLNLRGNDIGPSAGSAVLESLTRCRNLQVLACFCSSCFSANRRAGVMCHFRACYAPARALIARKCSV